MTNGAFLKDATVSLRRPNSRAVEASAYNS
jgi:hypothetical protein